MDIPRISGKTSLGRILRLPLKLIPPTMKMPIVQGRLKGKKWIVGSAIHSCWLGSYEYQKRLLFERTIAKGSVVFDIGAHVGYYTILASVLVGSAGRVIAFEPAPRNLWFLREHLRINNITNVTVIEAAVSDSCGVASFYEDDQDGSTSRLAPEGNAEVKLVSLDSLASQGVIPSPDYMKIDVEDAECHVISGARSVVATLHPTLFLSTHTRDLHRECCSLLASWGYEVEGIGGTRAEDCDELLATWKGQGMI